MERLHKILAEAGLGSRRSCERLIAEGRVTVNGKTITEMGTLADPEDDHIRFDRKPIRRQTKLYYLLNKPKGVVCTNSPDEKRPRAIDLLSRVKERLYPVGRLDEDSEGLLILTNDGDLANQLTHPRHEVAKTYRAVVKGYLGAEAVEKLQSGIHLAEGKTRRAKLRVVRRGRKQSVIDITIREGKNRQIRRMLARLDHPVISLRRTRIGPLEDPRLDPGQYRLLKKKELDQLRTSASPSQELKHGKA